MHNLIMISPVSNQLEIGRISIFYRCAITDEFFFVCFVYFVVLRFPHALRQSVRAFSGTPFNSAFTSRNSRFTFARFAIAIAPPSF